ncbi:TonB-dependent siderophore receptor [Herbaspirillum lusitanum]|uniref:TonB-dependent siderophore receptor n=1 Tax=Herbaspirillum lusitanum TaxID=213312 RepID=A0ABW9AC41_9BURK
MVRQERGRVLWRVIARAIAAAAMAAHGVHGLKHWLLALLLAGAPMLAHAQNPVPLPPHPAALINFDIPAGPLSDTLNRIARESARIISVTPELVRPYRAAAVRGRFDAEQAVRLALNGTPLALLVTASGSLSVQALRRSGAEDGAAAAELPTVIVRDVHARELREDNEQRSASWIEAGQKGPGRLIELPQAAAVVTRAQMDEQGGATLQDVLRYSAGLIGTRGVNFTDDSFNMRGFAAGLATSSNTPVFRDGLRHAPTMYASTVEPYGIERVEILRGPAAVLYGQSSPGGMINLITKQPPAEALHEVELQAGSDRHRQLALDLGGPIATAADAASAAAPEWRFRLTALAREADSEVDYVGNARRYIAPALSWSPSAATSLDLQASYQRSHTRYNWGLPVAGTLLANPNGELPANRYTGEPGFDRFDTEVSSLGYLLRHRLDEVWSWHQNLRYYDGSMQWNSAYGTALQANQRLLDRFAFVRNDSYRMLTVDNRIQAEWRSGAMEHDLSIGVDYARTAWVRRESRGSIGALDLFDPAYGLALAANIRPARQIDSVETQTGLYAQHRIRFDQHWVLLLGARRDWISSDIFSVLNNQQRYLSDQAFTTRAGLLYRTAAGYAPYLNFSTSFEPESSSVDFNGNSFRPTRARQIEAGLKYEAPDGKANMTAALFHILRRNELTDDAQHPGYSQQTGETRSRGAELEAQLQLDRRWRALASYTYMDALITRSENGDAGRSPSGIPRHALALWLQYRFDGELQGLRAGAGARRVIGTSGFVSGTTPTPARLPAYTVLDAMLSYDSGDWRFALNINNVLDARYVQSCYYAATGCYYGPGRTVLSSVTRRW